MANKQIAVVGLWHLGCVYATSFAKLGFKVTGFDIDKVLINNLNKGIPPIFEPGLENLLKIHTNKNLFFSFSEEVLKSKDYVFITHDVDVDNNDVSHLDVFNKLLKIVVNKISKGTTIVISSQIPAGTGRILVDILKKKGEKNPKVVYFPENLRLGQAYTSFLEPDRIILGSDNPLVLKQLQKDFLFNCPVVTMGLESAEMVKHALNSYLALCISFSSELSDLSEKIGANMLDIVKALKSDKRVSPNAPLNPGLGFAGGTLGRDVKSIIKLSKENRLKSKMMDSVYSVNKDRLPKLIEKISFHSSGLKGKTIGILGLTYKPKTDTLRRSMSIELAGLLKKKGSKIKAFDPAIKKQINDKLFINVSIYAEDFFRGLDVCVLMTDWAEFKEIDPKNIKLLMKKGIVIDTKNFLNADSYKKAGFRYIGMGI